MIQGGAYSFFSPRYTLLSISRLSGCVIGDVIVNSIKTIAVINIRIPHSFFL